MRFLQCLLAASLLGVHHVAATKAVFAHFMVDNTEYWDESYWAAEMAEAATANIDAFALNIPAGSSVAPTQLPYAFAAANSIGFKLFFSFDYAGNGAWAKSDVTSLLTEYVGNGAYFLHEGVKPLVSTFEGPANAADWVEIKSAISCFFIPDWSSLGAAPALALENGVADGLFSWAAWSYGGLPMDTYTDASYITDLSTSGKPFMMAASPWFYTNLPGYSKNWMWPVETMSLWADRWNEILFLQPDYVEIISWNDFGESHYIGTTYPSPPFETTGLATFDYVTGMDHDALRYPLAIWADQYKNNVATVTKESLVLTYLLHDITCDDGGTVINTASQLQLEFFPDAVLGERYIGYMATLVSEGDLTVTVGGKAIAASWVHKPTDGVGVYYGYVYLEDGVSGDVSATVTRNGAAIVTVTGESIGGCNADGYANFNLYVTGKLASASVSAQTTSIADLVCTSGTGATGFLEICSAACGLGYCPKGACVCTSIGKQPTMPVATGTSGFAKNDTNYIGLCSFLYPYGFTFPDWCTTTEQTLSTPSVSPFLPSTCTAGIGTSDWESYGVDSLCSWLCGYGYCPIRICTCTSEGVLNPLSNVVIPDDIDDVVTPTDDNMTLDNMALSEYDDINDGYDALFGYYVTYVDDLIQPSIDSFMDDDGWTYFSCSPSPCPNPAKISTTQPASNGMTVVWSFVNETGFWAVLEDQYGIEKDWVQLDTTRVQTACVPGAAEAACLTGYEEWHNYPVKADDVVVPNPKDVWTSSASTITGMPNYIDATIVDLLLGNWNGSAMDPVQVVSLPVALAQQTISAMQQVKTLGEKEKELEAAEKKELIGWIITAVLTLVPFVGEEVATVAGLASVARIIAMAGEAANAGYDIYSVVEDPSSAPMVLLGMIGGIGGVLKEARTGEGFVPMSAIRRGMSDDISKLGSTVSDQATQIKKIVKSCDL